MLEALERNQGHPCSILQPWGDTGCPQVAGSPLDDIGRVRFDLRVPEADGRWENVVSSRCSLTGRRLRATKPSLLSKTRLRQACGGTGCSTLRVWSVDVGHVSIVVQILLRDWTKSWHYALETSLYTLLYVATRARRAVSLTRVTCSMNFCLGWVCRAAWNSNFFSRSAYILLGGITDSTTLCKK